MSKTSFLKCILCLVFTLFSLQAAAAPAPAQIKKNMFSQLDFIRDVFEAKYAPSTWKHQHLGWSLDQEYQRAARRIQQLKNPTVKQYHYILKDFFNSTQDYHVSIRFYSTEMAMLPFTIKGSQGRYFISFIQRELLPPTASSLQVGDEIITFDRKPIDQVVQELRKLELGSNTLETDQALAELLLTNRDGSAGCRIPFGHIEVGIKKKEGEIISYPLTWLYNPEQIRDFAKIGMAKEDERPLVSQFDTPLHLQQSIRESGFFDKLMLHPAWDRTKATSTAFHANPHAIGVKKSFIPPLGRKIWQADRSAIFDAYIFDSPTGKQIGYIRIPHYMGSDVDIEEFAEVIRLFEVHTDGLIIDQINNPGGSVFYLYALASALTDRPLATPKHHLALTQEDVNLALSLLPVLELVQDDKTAQEFLGESFDGYPVDYKFAILMKEFCQLIIDEWNEGHLYTRATHVLGVDEIQPHATARYTKPILLLTNSLCFSGGDFFPAILQDSKRALVFGTRTAGAGGHVLRTKFPNHLGIRDFYLTGSLAERSDKKPLENLGVTPDITYSYSVRDLQGNYADYSTQILQVIENLVEEPNPKGQWDSSSVSVKEFRK